MPPLFHIDHHTGVPAYRQLMDQVKLQAATGVLAAGTEMPSTRAMAADLNLNPMTVSKAYSLLERDGVLERRRGQTLTVKAQSGDTHSAEQRLAPLREQLTAVARLARQLEISEEEAIRMLKESFDEGTAP